MKGSNFTHMGSQISTVLTVMLGLMLAGCPTPPSDPPLRCGTGMVPDDIADTCVCIENAHPMDDGEWCDCDTLYHWNADSTECIMDTTSHEFTWFIDTIGLGALHLDDISAVAENDVWIAGYFTSDEIPGYDETRANAAHWDGEKWNIHRITEPRWGFAGLTSVCAIASDHVLFGANALILWDGETSTGFGSEEGFPLGFGHIKDIWAASADEVYFIGDEGKIGVFNGVNFELMHVPTEIDLKRIDGYKDPSSGLTKLWVTAFQYPSRGAMLHYDGTTWVRLWNETTPFYPNPAYVQPGAVFVPDEAFLVVDVGGTQGVGNTLVAHHSINDFNRFDITYIEDRGFIRDISGNAINDYFMVGDLSTLVHYNGSTYRTYYDIPLNDEVDIYAASQIGNVVFAVSVYSAHVYRGIRN